MGLIGGVVLASTEFGYPNSLVRGSPPLKPRRKVVLMRSRNIQIPLRLSEEEYAVLMKKVGKCRCSRESYIRSLLNQLLIVARTKNFIDAPQLRKLMEEIRATNKMLWQTFSEERNGNH